LGACGAARRELHHRGQAARGWRDRGRSSSKGCATRTRSFVWLLATQVTTVGLSVVLRHQNTTPRPQRPGRARRRDSLPLDAAVSAAQRRKRGAEKPCTYNPGACRRWASPSSRNAIIGGFHLSGPMFEPMIEPTVDALAELDPSLLVPGHCTGWKAVHRIASQFPTPSCQAPWAPPSPSESADREVAHRPNAVEFRSSGERVPPAHPRV
jgi:hypothetical protein